MTISRRALGMGLIIVMAVAALLAGVLATPKKAYATGPSMKIALVPNDGQPGGTSESWPTSGFPNGYAPSFTNLPEANIETDVADPIAAGGYDTVVLVQLADLNTRLGNATFKSRIQSFINGGGKLIIQPVGDNSAHQNINYTNFFYPFQNTDPVDPTTPSDLNVLTNVENSTLASTDVTSPNYINNNVMFQNDSVTDGAIMSTCDQHWYATQVAYADTTVFGPMTAYAKLGNGLIVLANYDNDVFDSSEDGSGYGAADTHEGVQLRRMWLNELLQPVNPDGLPRSVKVFGVSLNPASSSAAAGATLTFTAHVVDNTVGIPGKTVNFSITSGPDAGKTGSGVTDANGNATFSFVTVGGGTDVITASVAALQCDDHGGPVPASEVAAVSVSAAPSPSPTAPPALPKAGATAVAATTTPWAILGLVAGFLGIGIAAAARRRRDSGV